MSFDGSPAPFRLPSVTVVGRLHSIFDLASYLPFPVGSIASGADAGLFYKEGDHEAAGWAAASIIPFEKYFKVLKELKWIRGILPFEREVPSQVPKHITNDMGLITSVIPIGGGTLKALSALKIENPLLNITYTPKVMRQMTQDIYHDFPKSVEGFGHYGIKKKIVGNDGIMCNHRFFRVID